MANPAMPQGASEKDGKVYDRAGNLIEIFDGVWRQVRNGDRSGWWRFHDHYDRNGYCDNPGRGY
jgi:hypothetical protein